MLIIIISIAVSSIKKSSQNFYKLTRVHRAPVVVDRIHDRLHTRQHDTMRKKLHSSLPHGSPTKKKDRVLRWTWRKPKNKPKRPLSAYNFFFADVRQTLLRERVRARSEGGADPAGDGGLGFGALARTVAARWKALSLPLKAPYVDQAQRETAAYKIALAQWEREQEDEALVDDDAPAIFEVGDAPLVRALEAGGVPMTPPLTTENEHLNLDGDILSRALNFTPPPVTYCEEGLLPELQPDHHSVSTHKVKAIKSIDQTPPSLKCLLANGKNDRSAAARRPAPLAFFQPRDDTIETVWWDAPRSTTARTAVVADDIHPTGSAVGQWAYPCTPTDAIRNYEPHATAVLVHASPSSPSLLSLSSVDVDAEPLPLYDNVWESNNSSSYRGRNVNNNHNNDESPHPGDSIHPSQTSVDHLISQLNEDDCNLLVARLLSF